MAIRQEYFYLVTYLSVLEVTFDKSIVDLYISRTFRLEGFQDHIGWKQELLLLVDELDSAVTVCLVVTCHGLSEHIISDTTHLGGVCSEKPTPIQETTPRERHRIVPLIHDQHTNDPFISIDDKVATKLMHVFLGSDQLLFTHAFKVAEVGANHDWHFTHFGTDSFNGFTVDTPAQCSV